MLSTPSFSMHKISSMAINNRNTAWSSLCCFLSSLFVCVHIFHLWNCVVMAIGVIILMKYHQSVAALEKKERIHSNKLFELRTKGKVKFGHAKSTLCYDKRFSNFLFIILSWMIVRIACSRSEAKTGVHSFWSINYLNGWKIFDRTSKWITEHTALRLTAWTTNSLSWLCIEYGRHTWQVDEWQPCIYSAVHSICGET